MRYLALAWLLVLAPVAHAGEADLQQLLSGRDVPLVLHLKDLDQTWRRFTLGAGAGASSPASAYLALLGGASSSAYFTRGQIVTAHDEPFLVAYHLQSKPVDFQGLMRGGMRPDQLPKPEPPTGDTPLNLALIHLRTTGNLVDIEAFDLERELAGGDDSPEARAHAREQTAKAAGLDHLRQLAVAVTAYAQDGDKTLPPLDDLAATRQALQPYAGGKDLFGTPPCVPNAALAKKKLATIAKPAAMVLFFEAQAGSGGRGVVFLDGHVERVTDERWAALKKASQIP